MDDLALTKDQQLKIAFNLCKKEALHPTKGFKLFHRKLKQNCKVEVNKEEVTLEKLKPHDIVIFGAPTENFTEAEMKAMKAYMDQGGCVFLLLGEGGSGRWNHMNDFFTEEFGITFNEDCVVRTVLHKYFHPKEVCITNGITNRAINAAAGKFVPGTHSSSTPTNQMGGTIGGSKSSTLTAATLKDAQQANEVATSLAFVYPHGVTMTVQKPGVPILSSGFMAYPLNRPIAAIWESNNVNPETKRKGKLLLFGSALSFDDNWFGKEENETLLTILVDILMGKVALNQIDVDNPEISDYNYLPDTASLAERLRVCVEESEDLPRDFTQLYDTKLFKFDTNLVPEVITTYQKLDVKYEPLTLIHPEFQCPLPPRLPATFEPMHREPPPPALDLFDLDEHFASDRVRLSQLTNKCQSEDLETYITESAEIMGVTKKLRSPRNKDPRALLDYVFRQLLTYKKNDHSLEGNMGTGSPTGPVGGIPEASVVRVLRVQGRPDGTTDNSPFENNAPWALTLQVDYSNNTIRGELALDQQSVNFAAQRARVNGRALPNNTLEWEVTLTNVVGEQVRYVFNGSFANPPQLSGMFESSNGHASAFMYVVDVAL